jgi:hypothetical protein
MEKIKNFILINIFIFSGYLFLSWIPSLLFTAISPFWLSCAQAVFAVLIWGEYPLFGIFLALYAANILFCGWGVDIALSVAFGSTFALFISLFAIKRLRFDFRDVFKDAKNFLIFTFFMCFINSLISSAFASLIFLAYGKILYADLLNFVENWFISSFATIVSITPFFLFALDKAKKSKKHIEIKERPCRVFYSYSSNYHPLVFLFYISACGQWCKNRVIIFNNFASCLVCI